MRQVVYVTGDAAGNLSRRLALSGTIRFDGRGAYTIQGSLADSQSASSPRAYTFSGTYAISASGLGWISSPLTSGTSVFGLATGGVFVGSSTESGYNDLFLASQARSSPPGSADFQGRYRVAYFDAPSSAAAQITSSWFALQPDGAGGNRGAVDVDGYFVGNASTLVKQSLAGVQYSLATGTMTFPAGTVTQPLIAGPKTFSLSTDGNLLFGGSANGFDLLVGVRVATEPGQFQGLYYQAGLDEDATQYAQRGAALDTYYGSLVTIPSAGQILGHQRVSPVLPAGPFDFTYRDPYPASGQPEYEDTSAHVRYATGAGGFARLGFADGPRLGIEIALKAPTTSGSGVYLSPVGVVNAASSAPFTSGIARGELVTLYGSNLSGTTMTAPALPFPTSLGGVQVLVNGRMAPVYAVSPTQVSILIPAATEFPIARIEVVNNGTRSNAVTAWMSESSVGVFTVPPGGLGYGAILRPDYSVLLPDRPAQAGDTLSLYLTGLGAVTNPPADGAAAPVAPLSLAAHQVTVTVGGRPALITYAGLAPTLAGLYQINFEVPAGTGSGDVSIDVAGPDSYTSQAQIPLTGGVRDASVIGAESSRERLMRLLREWPTRDPQPFEFQPDQER